MKARRWLRPLLTVGLVAPLVTLLALNAHAQFNPGGRKKPKGKSSATAPKRSSTPRSEGAAPPGQKPKPPQPERPSSPPPEDTDRDEASADREALLERYTQVALSQPGAEFPLRRLAELARARDGNLERLLGDFEQRASAAGPSQFAATVALAGLYEQAGRREDARGAYERARRLDAKSTVVELALARLLEKGGDRAGARAAYQRALPQLKGPERELSLRAAMRLALDDHDFDEAARAHAELVRAANGSVYVRAELGRELLTRGEAARAVTELRKVASASEGDNRALAPALRDLGAALIGAGETREAMQVLGRALTAASGQPGLSREIDELLVDAYRREGRLPELVAELEKKGDASVERLRLLGRLHEESGNMERALASYRRALTKAPTDVETRMRVVRLLELQGELDEAVRQYDELLRRSPGDAALVFRFAELLLQRGERARALSHLERLERSARGDEDAQVALIDFYERIGENERSERLLTALSGSGVRDSAHLVELGSRHYRDGKRDEARQIWRRILTVERDRTRALVTLGDVYLDHDFTDDALAAFREAAQRSPNDTRVKRSLAMALERIGAASNERQQPALFDEARALWEALLAGYAKGTDAPTRRAAQEARQHIVKLWQRGGQLGARRSALVLRLHQKPPDIESGRLLAEAELLARDYPAAERTLRIVTTAEPGDTASLSALERVLALEGKRDEAILVLKKLVLAEPSGAREYYQRMARHAAEDYQDAHAIEYAAKAVELNPDDAQGHQRLAEMYRRHQQNDLAIASYRQAIAKNDRLYPAYLALAELLLGRGKDEEADLWLRRALRTAPDEELVARAARLSLEINLARQSVDKLEADLLPLALGQPKKPLYRRLLLEVYGAEAYPLVHRAQSGAPAERKAAREELARLGERAVRPLLDSLGDERLELQRTALALLSHLGARGANAALLAYAGGEAPEELREGAVLAAGKSSDVRMLPKLEALVFEDSGDVAARARGKAPPGGRARSDSVAIAAAWSIARLDAPEAAPLIERLARSDVPELRALGALGLGRAVGSRDAVRSLALLSEVAQSSAFGPLPRAAAAHALGMRVTAPKSEGERVDAAALQSPAWAALTSLLDASDGLVQEHALWALARRGSPAVEPALAEALVSQDARARSVALAAAAAYGTGRASESETRSEEGASRATDPLELVPEGHLDVGALLESALPAGATPVAAARALVRLEDALQAAAELAARTSSERALVVARALTARSGEPAFGELTTRLSDVPPALRKDAERAARAITQRSGSAYLSLVHHDEAAVRAAAISVLGLLPGDADARAALQAALLDPAPSVQDAAFEALGRSPHTEQRETLAQLLETSDDWRLRHRAAQALGVSLARGNEAGAGASAVTALERAKKQDPSRLVRDTAAEALAQAARPTAGQLDRPPSPPLE